MIETEGLTHIHLMVRDLDRSLAFYRSVFGMEEQFRAGPMVFLRTAGGRDTITLNHDPSFEGGSGGVDHFGFRLKNKADLERAIAEVKAAGGQTVDRGEHGPDSPYAYVKDPDGYRIEL